MPPSESKIVRYKAADGSIREYRYPKKKAAREPYYGPDSLKALTLAFKESRQWKGYSEKTRKNWNSPLSVLDEIGELAVATIKRRDIQTLADAVASSRGPGAANDFIKITKVLFGFAVDREWIDFSPMVQLRQEAGDHLPTWSEQNLLDAMHKAPPELQRVLTLGVFTGLRRGDLCAVTWDAYDGSRIRWRMGKTGDEVFIPVHDELRAQLATWDGEDGPILRNAHGKPWTPDHLGQHLARRVDIGVRLTLHGLRKLAAVRLAEAGCTIHEICAILGWRTLTMAQLYTLQVERQKLAESGMAKVRFLSRGNVRSEKTAT